MESRKYVVTVAVILLLTMSLPSLNGRNVAHAQTENAFPIIELGYSPGTLSSINYGVPIYTVGDSMWLLSGSSSVFTVGLISPSGLTVTYKSVSESAAYLLHNFSSTDPQGEWALQINLIDGLLETVPFEFVNPVGQEASTKLQNYTIDSGALNMNFQLSPGGGLGFVGCLTSSSVNSTVDLPLPGSLGSGTVLLNGSLRDANVSVVGAPSQPFSFWFEMDYPYSYVGNATGEVITRDLPSVSTLPAILSPSNNTATLQVVNGTNPRSGLYQLRAYFESGAGISFEQTSVLVLASGGWIWQGGCDTFPVSSTTFSREQNLNQPPQTWPRSLYLTYELQGVNSYSFLPLRINISRIDLSANYVVQSLGQHGVVTTNYPSPVSYLNLTVSASKGFVIYNVYGDSIYFVGKSYPTFVQVNPYFGSQELEPVSANVSSPFTVYQETVAVGKLVVGIKNGSLPVQDASVVVENGYGGEITGSSNATGFASFFLPQGRYNVTVSSGTYAMSQNSTVSVNLESDLLFSIPTPTPPPSSLPYVLISFLIVGLVLNVWGWLIRPRRGLKT